MSTTLRPVKRQPADVTDAWWAAYVELKKFRAEHGTCLIPQAYVTDDGFRLGKWCHNHRTRFRARSQDNPSSAPLADELVVLLERIPGWLWNTAVARSSGAAPKATVKPAVKPRRPKAPAEVDLRELDIDLTDSGVAKGSVKTKRAAKVAASPVKDSRKSATTILKARAAKTNAVATALVDSATATEGAARVDVPQWGSGVKVTPRSATASHKAASGGVKVVKERRRKAEVAAAQPRAGKKAAVVPAFADATKGRAATKAAAVPVRGVKGRRGAVTSKPEASLTREASPDGAGGVAGAVRPASGLWDKRYAHVLAAIDTVESPDLPLSMKVRGGFPVGRWWAEQRAAAYAFQKGNQGVGLNVEQVNKVLRLAPFPTRGSR